MATVVAFRAAPLGGTGREPARVAPARRLQTPLAMMTSPVLPAPRRAVARKALRVLLAEDDSALRSMIGDALRADGHQVTEASNGHELLALLTRERLQARAFDVVVSDLAMPGVGGMAVLGRLYHEPLAPPVVLMTAFGDPEVHSWARSLDAVAMFDKPFDLDDLKTVLLNL